MAAPRLLWKVQVSGGPSFMWIEKLAAGVVRVQTPIGPRYIFPSFFQRVYFLWMFRNFPVLPHAVLSGRQQRLIDRVCGEQSFASIAYSTAMEEAPVIGTIERRPPPSPKELPLRCPAGREGSLAAETRPQA